MNRGLVVTVVVATAAMVACSEDESSDAGDAIGAPASAPAEAPGPTTASPTGDLEAWCLGWSGPAIPEGDLQEVFESLVAHAEALDAVAPAEIAEASDVLLQRHRTLVDHFEAHDWDPNAPRLGAEFEREMEEAGATIDAYGESNC